MSTSDAPRVVHRVPGRVRVCWPRNGRAGEPDPSRLLASIEGASSVRASALTGNVLVQFDERVTNADQVLAAIARVAADSASRAGQDRRQGRSEGRSGSRPPAGPPAESRRVTPPARLQPHEPSALELLERAARTTGAVAGLCLVAVRGRAADSPPGAAAGAGVAAGLALVDGYPVLHGATGRMLGYRGRSAVLGVVGIAAHAASGSPLGLTIAAVIAVRQLLESREQGRAVEAYRGRSRVRPGSDSGSWTAKLDDGERLPASGRIKDGSGFAVGRNGLLRPVGPGSELASGAGVVGGPILVELGVNRSPPLSAGPLPVDDVPRRGVPPEAVALAAAAITLVVTRSFSRAVGALLLLSRRGEILGRDAADAGARLRALRSGALPLRNDVVIRKPELVLLDGVRILSDGLEVADGRPSSPAQSETIDLALSVAALAGSPWGPIRGPGRRVSEGTGSFDGNVARAEIEGRPYELTPEGLDGADADAALRLVISSDGDSLGTVRLRPRLAADASEFVAACRRHGIEVALAHDGIGSTAAVQSVAAPLGITLIRGRPGEIVREESTRGRRIAFVTDAADDGEALMHADLTIGLAVGTCRPFLPAVDVVIPDLATAAAVLAAGAGRDLAARDAHLLSSGATALGAAWVATGSPRFRTAARVPNVATIAALLAAWLRLRGGSPPSAATMRLVDPRPERWGRRSPADVLAALATSERGLSAQSAAARIRRRASERPPESAFVGAVRDQLRSPLTGILAAGAVLSLATGAVADVALISAVIGLNAVVGAVQARQAGTAADALERMGQVHADVLRAGRRTRLSASELVPGDILLLTSGERIAADARVLLSRGLEVDEAALTGESFPVAKRVEGGSPAARIVLDGTDVTVGSGRAVVFAVGSDTRFGAAATALKRQPAEASPLDRRLHRMLFEILPIIAGGGLLVTLAGILWRRPVAAQLALGAGTAIAAVPEGLPLLSGLGQAAVARRLVSRSALVRRLGAVESLGRVNVACIDKTGTLTENRLRLQAVVAPSGARAEPDALPEGLRPILRCAALASPPPHSSAQGTDAAVVEGAKRAGLDGGLEEQRTHEIPFDPARAFRGALVDGRACVKGSPEELVWRCTRVRGRGRDDVLDDSRRAELLDLAHELAGDGLRVLMVAEGPAATSLADPDDLVALGFLGIRDTVRSGAAEAIRHCREAGIRPIMLTGDHPATASAIGAEISLLDGGRVLTGVELEELSEEELATALEGASVVARITPMEKLRIVEALQRRGYVVAMTGDGVNDAPALRLADVGVAMGPSGTEVARQAADLVLADDDLTVFVDALIEGRTFWANLRVALAMLLGGNLGEVAFIATLTCAGFAAPLTARQVLAVNLVSDVLPAISLVVQSPKGNELSRLAREGDAVLGPRLRREIGTRAAATATPALAAYVLAHALLGPARAQSVGFASIVLTQLTQTLDAGREAGRTGLATTAAVGGSAALLAAAVHVRPLQSFLRLTAPGVLGWGLIVAAGAVAPAVSRALAANGRADRALALEGPSHGSAAEATSDG